jgi:adenosylmethionine-8-amino-7-oxononanoate aminotransferase
MVEQRTENPRVGGSIPPLATPDEHRLPNARSLDRAFDVPVSRAGTHLRLPVGPGEGHLPRMTTLPASAPIAAHDPALDALWMPFTANKAFKARPRMLVGAKDMHYTSDDGRRILDGTAGLWCVNAGHCRAPIVEAIAKAAATLDFAPAFQMGHPASFQLANALKGILPAGINHVFFSNSGSEAVDSALKIALAYHIARGEPGRTRFIGRERGYHGVGFGGISVGGIAPNKAAFSAQLLPASITSRTRTISRRTPTRAACRRTGRTSPRRSRA